MALRFFLPGGQHGFALVLTGFGEKGRRRRRESQLATGWSRVANRKSPLAELVVKRLTDLLLR